MTEIKTSIVFLKYGKIQIIIIYICKLLFGIKLWEITYPNKEHAKNKL